VFSAARNEQFHHHIHEGKGQRFPLFSFFPSLPPILSFSLSVFPSCEAAPAAAEEEKEKERGV
jgi:hypothetical protein